ncbi:MAG TPA: glycosyltransferase family 39 protein [Anaerolineales bacterium]|nr:glycosyltransferase family 39 protein [Anaerolineales bacterium]
MIKKTLNKMTNTQIAILLALFVLLVLILTQPQIGLTWDEPAYFAASESYANWFGELFTRPGKAFSQPMIDAYWSINHEHPPLDKIWSGLVWKLSKGVFDDLMAHRLGNMLLVAVLVGMVYTLIAENYNRRTGLLASAILLSLPRFFFHAHLAALDVPAAFMIFLVVFTFWRTKDRPAWQHTILLGIVWGLAVATKINAVFVMPTLLLWVLLFQREKFLLIRLVVSGFVAFIVFVAVWPWLFPQIGARLWEYILWITVNHWEIGQYYLGQFTMPPPWHFPFVIAFAVIPTAVLVFYGVGIARIIKRKEKRGFGVLLLFNSLVPLLALAIGQSMVYDNERLFMPAFIFTAALAAVGVDWGVLGVQDWLRAKGRSSLAVPAAILLAALVLLPQMISAAPLYPHLLSYYSGSVGGLRGANRLGLETTYWCETYTEALRYINENAQPEDVVWVDPWSHDVMVYYQRQGDLRSDVQIAVPFPTESIFGPFMPLVEANYQHSDIIVVQYRQTSTVSGGAAWPILTWLEKRTPVVSVRHQGIPLIEVYQN